MTSPAARRLTQAHRLAQNRLGALTVAQMATAWRLIDPTNLDGTAGGWLSVSEGIIAGQRAASSALAANYWRAFRLIELRSGKFSPVMANPADPTAVRTSLLVTGPYRLKAAMAAGTPLARAVDVAKASSAAAAMRHALNGGRDTLTASSQADPRSSHLERIISATACDFCAAADVEDGFHDGCGCTVEPVFD